MKFPIEDYFTRNESDLKVPISAGAFPDSESCYKHNSSNREKNSDIDHQISVSNRDFIESDTETAIPYGYHTCFRHP